MKTVFIKSFFTAVLLFALSSQAETRNITIDPATAQTAQKQESVVKGAWGTKNGEFGKEDEASRPGPMDFCIHDGTLLVLDTVNGRIQAFDLQSGDFQGALPIGTKSTDFMTIDQDGTIAVMDAFTKREIRFFDSQGKAGRALDLPESVKLPSAIFLRDGGLHVEDRHELVYEIKPASEDKNSRETAISSQNGGRPWKNGGAIMARKIKNRIKVRTTEKEKKQTTETYDLGLRDAGTIGTIIGLDADKDGNVIIGVRRIQKTEDKKETSDLVVTRFSPSGDVLGTITMPDAYITDHYRKYYVMDDGSLLQMQTSNEGVQFVKWEFSTK